MFKEFFYWSHYFLKKYVKVNKEPIEGGYFAVCLLMFINTLVLVSVVEYYMNFKIDIEFFSMKERYSVKSYVAALIMFLPFFIINYICMYRRKRRDVIFEYYDSLSEKRRTKGKVFYWVYLIISVFLSFAVIHYINNLDAVEDNPQEIKLKELMRSFDPDKR